MASLPLSAETNSHPWTMIVLSEPDYLSRQEALVKLKVYAVLLSCLDVDSSSSAFCLAEDSNLAISPRFSFSFLS